MDDFIRVTIRYPRKYEEALMLVKENNCISKNAVIVKAIRELAEKATEEQTLGRDTSVATNNNTALQGGASINQGNKDTKDEYSKHN